MKAAEEMKREQKEVKLRMILQDYHRRNNYELQQAVNDILALDALPPAEGAKKVQWSGYGELGNISQKPLQPTAEGAEKLQKLMTDISEWSNKTFGDGQRNPAIVYHLKKEVNELIAVFEGNPRNAHRQLWFEYADCLMLLLDSALHAGFTARDLIDATREKLEINKTRKWGKPDENGVIEHVEQPQPTAEGAEEILASLVESLGEPDNSVTDHSYEIRPLTVEGKREWWMFHNGVGSGEPLKQWLGNFATLHAQKIADKMVSERLREELMTYDKFLSNTYWGISHITKREEAVNEYLKSRDSHDTIR